MKLLSVNVAQPHEVEIDGKPVLTGIYKLPVAGRVWLGKLNLAGDGQADLTFHGGEDQAAYAYPIEHFEHWRQKLGWEEMPPGSFGENFTTSGLLETEVCVGDILQIGSAVVQATFPRRPCFKFAHKTGRPDLMADFRQSGRSGFYMRVLSEGDVGAGDQIAFVERDPAGISIRAMLGLQRLHEGDEALLRRALAIPSLAPRARRELERRLAAPEG